MPRPLPLGRRGIYMLRQRVFSIRTVSESALLCLVLILGSRSTIAQSNDSNYSLVLASGFLCDPDHAEACPAVAKNANGSTFEMSGAGMFDAQNKSVKAAGTYTHKSPNGIALETGVWIASELVSFGSYGIAPAALRKQGLALGPRPFGPKRLPISSSQMPTGGFAVFRIRLFPISGASTTAVLQVNCALGEVPRERSVEGIRLTLGENSTDFSEEVSGRVMFLAMRPDLSAPAKTPQQEAVPESPEPPNN